MHQWDEVHVTGLIWEIIEYTWTLASGMKLGNAHAETIGWQEMQHSSDWLIVIARNQLEEEELAILLGVGRNLPC